MRKFKNIKIYSVIGISIVSMFFSCSRDKGLDPALQPKTLNCDSIKYSKDILPIINASCATPYCHDAGSSNGDYTSYAGVKAKVDNNSFRNRVIIQANMPAAAPLPGDQLQKIKCWLDKGAPNN